MFVSCCSAPRHTVDPKDRRALWIALVLNLRPFSVEIVASPVSGSVSLMADVIDFFGDAGNDALSLTVVGLLLAARAKSGRLQGGRMGVFGVFVLGKPRGTRRPAFHRKPRRWGSSGPLPWRPT